MNSETFTPDAGEPAAPGTPDTASPPRRRRTRRAATDNPTTPVASAESTDADEPSSPVTTAAPSRSRRRASGTTTATVTSSDEPAAESPGLREVIEPINVQEALISVAAPGDTVAGEAPLAAPPSRQRRRRGRGGRGSSDDGAPDTSSAPVADGETFESVAPEEEGAEIAGYAELGQPSDPAVVAGGVPDATTGRRRRRRSRGGGRASLDAGVESGDESLSSDDPIASSEIADSGDATLSPAVLRRFDHRNWRERPGRTAPQPYVQTAHVQPAIAEPAVPAQVSEPPRTDEPAPIARGNRDPRWRERRPAAPFADPFGPERVAPIATVQAQPATSGAAPAPVTSPVVTPNRTIAPPVPASDGSPALDDRIERLLASQAIALQQQQRAIESMTATMAALQGAIERMTTGGIAAGMPRAGLFVDAPNVIYAADNARVGIDYGRMLDFLGRGREMVHAIVYAPVTEDTGFRFENQRFVQPFINKGYKLVTKPLKRFPDGTAKGNFDIELAIDIVTMSQRLDVVILISGDSDFSRLVELIQSRGVRVEVVAFASNVSWELVQMADVFIDIGQYINEFRPR